MSSDMSRLHVRTLLVRALFPLIILSAVLNQERPYEILIAIGQLVSIACVATAVVLPIAALPGRIWPVALAVGTVILRAARLIFGSDPILQWAYTLVVGLEFCAAGAVVAILSPTRLRRQMIIFMTLSLVLMLLQLTGVGSWTQVLRTDFHLPGEESLRQYGTLFVPLADLVPTTLQMRPAGFMSANNIFSVFLIGALAFHYGMPTRGKLTWRDLVLCGATIVAMAKIGFLSFALIAIYLIVAGGHDHRRRMLKVTVVFTLFMAGYAFLFPGAFEFNMSVALWLLNFQLRLANVVLLSGQPELISLLAESEITSDVDPGLLIDQGTRSGYALLVPYFHYSLVALGAVAILVWLGIRYLRNRFRDYATASILMAGIILLIPLITPLIGTNIFWFLAGIALMPALVRFERRYRDLFGHSDPGKLRTARNVSALGIPRPRSA
jgi:hypothetical protein